MLAWLARHPRWTFHFTPTSASWLNAVENFFSKMTRQRIRRGVFHSIADLSGTAHVIDGDTIVIGDTHIRLWGIDAPERQQTCQGKNGDVYECGRDSAAVLFELTRGRRVECAQRDSDRYSRIVAVCPTESGELNAAMVRRRFHKVQPRPISLRGSAGAPRAVGDLVRSVRNAVGVATSTLRR